MKIEPVVSIIVPVYNAAAHLERCVESLVQQNLENLEILMVDDGSNDGSAEICDYYSQRDSRVRAIHGPNFGPSHARNIGVRGSRGEFIQFVDADDFVDTGMSALLLGAQRSQNADLVIAGFEVIDDTTGSRAGYHLDEMRVLDRAQFLNCFHELRNAHLINSCWNKLYRASLIYSKGIEFCEELDFAEDALFNFSYMARSRSTIVLTETPYRYIRYATDDSLSRRYRPNMYEIARLEMEAMTELFVGSELGLLDIERGHALNLVTQVVPHFARMMVPFSYPTYLKVVAEIRKDEYYLRYCRDLRCVGVRERILLALFHSRRFELIWLIESLSRSASAIQVRFTRLIHQRASLARRR